MYFLGSFTQGSIASAFPQLVAGDDYSFFSFPTINPDFTGAIIAGSDLVVAFNDKPGTQSFLRFLSSAEAQQNLVSRGYFISTNSNVDLLAYPDEIDRKVAEQLTTASVVRFDLDDMLSTQLQGAIWKALLDYVQEPSELDNILEELEAAATNQ